MAREIARESVGWFWGFVLASVSEVDYCSVLLILYNPIVIFLETIIRFYFSDSLELVTIRSDHIGLQLQSSPLGNITKD